MSGDKKGPSGPDLTRGVTAGRLRAEHQILGHVGDAGVLVVQVGDDAVLVVDTNSTALGEKVLAAIRTITKAPVRYIVNTSADRDRMPGTTSSSFKLFGRFGSNIRMRRPSAISARLPFSASLASVRKTYWRGCSRLSCSPRTMPRWNATGAA